MVSFAAVRRIPKGQVFGEKVYCTYYKQKYYGSLATAVATTNISEISYATANDNIVSGSGDDVDYSNAKGVKAQTDVTFNAGRLRVYTANDGGEGLESKDAMTINGGVIELNCADDCIKTAGNLVINGGYIFGIGAAQSVREGSLTGTQGYYQGSKTLSTSATYWYASGDNTIYGKIPAAASSSTSAYMFVSVPGMTSGTSPTSYGTSAPTSATAIDRKETHELQDDLCSSRSSLRVLRNRLRRRSRR